MSGRYHEPSFVFVDDPAARAYERLIAQDRALMAGLVPCPSAQCDRFVRNAGTYCCAGCRLAWESDPRWDVDGLHSEACDERQAERGVTR